MTKIYSMNIGRLAIFKQILFVILALFISVQGNSQSRKGKISIKNERWEKGGFFEGFKPEQELLEKRSRTTKQFLNTDGSSTAQIGGMIHYQDNAGAWQDINFDIKKNASSEVYQYVNETNEYKSYFPKVSGSNAVKFRLNDKSTLSWWNNPSLKLTSNGTTIKSYNMVSQNANANKNSIRYNNVYPNVIEEFEVIPGGLENNTIITSLTPEMAALPANGMLEFSQTIELKAGWKVLVDGKVQQGNFNSKSFNISIPGFEDGLTFSPIFVYDKNLTKEEAMTLVFSPMEKLTSAQRDQLNKYVYQCNYKAEFTSEGLKITTILPASWLKNTDRAFPVTIDPIVTIGTTPGVGDFRGPITHWYGFQRHADLYLQSEIGAYGLITNIEYYRTGTEAARTKPTKVYMRDTPATTLTGTSAWNSPTYTGGLTALFDGNTTQDATAGWKMITLTTPYTYASGNLLVMVYDQYGGGGSAQYISETNITGTQRQAYYRVDTTDLGDGSATAVEDYLPAIRITYLTPNPPTIASFTPTEGCSSTGTVVITGTNLSGASSVTIGGTAVTSYVVNSGTQITAIVSTGTTGTIQVTTPFGATTSVDTFTVNVSPANSPIADGASSVCVGGTSPAFTNATSGGVWSIVNGTGTASIDASGVVTGITAGTVSVNYTTSNGTCSTVVAFAMSVNALPTPITVTPSTQTVCQGVIQQLSVTGNVIIASGTIGSGTALTAATAQPTAFCNRWPNYWSQTIYTAAELTALGFVSGSSITSMAYNINTLGDAATNANFTVKIGTYGSATFPNTTFLNTSSYTTVYGPSTYTHTATGFQEITFVTPYLWDGVSNIVVNVTMSGADSINNSRTYYTTTTGNTTLWVNSFSGTTTTGTTSTNRLNLRLTGQKILPVTWSPAANLYTDATATTAYTGQALNTVYAMPTADAVYTATATNSSNCTTTATATLTVLSAPIPTGDANQSFCLSNSPTVDDLVATGTNVVWYDAATAGNLIASTTPLVDGIYYAASVNGSCESSSRLAVTVTVNPTPSAPTGDATQTYCNGTVASLQATGTGIQWYAASTGGTPLASTTVLTDATTYYASQTVNGCESTDRFAVAVTVLCYCTPTYTFGTSDGDLISNVQILTTTLSNNTGATPGGASYTYYTGLPNYTATLQAGSSYSVSVSVGTFGNQNVAVWIDYNDNFIFETSERVGYTTGSITGGGTATFNISLACNPSLGLHRMRIRDVWNTTGINIDPCINYGYGETEDYDVTISAAVACPQPTNLGVNTITSNSANLTWNIGCAETLWDLHLTTAGGGAPTGTPSNPNVASPFPASSLLPSTAYEFYVRADCEANGTSLWTGPFTFTTNALPPLNDECVGAYPVTVNADLLCTSVTAGTIASATASATDATACFGTEDDDVWFSFVATATSHSISLLDITGGTTDLFHSLWTGVDCSSLTLVPGTCSDPESSAPTGLTIGQTYYLRVYSWTDITGQTSSFNVCIGTPPPPPANDECINATSIVIDDTFCNGVNNNGTNVSATNSGVANPTCFNYGLNDVWFSFVVPSDVATVDVSTDFTGGTLLDTEIALYSGACGGLSVIACSQDEGTTTLSNGFSWNSLITNATVVAGQTYYVRVAGYSETATGSFCVKVSTNTLGTNSFDNSNFTFYPNPVKDVLNLSYSENITKVQVINLLGQEVRTNSMNATQAQVDMSNLPTGTYLVKVTTNDKVKTIKVIKQ